MKMLQYWKKETEAGTWLLTQKGFEWGNDLLCVEDGVWGTYCPMSDDEHIARGYTKITFAEAHGLADLAGYELEEEEGECKMTMINWVKNIENNREKLIEAIKQAYTNAYGSHGSMEYTVILDKNGNIHEGYEDKSTTDGAVWHGESIYIYAAKQWMTEVDWHGYFEKSGIFSDDLQKVLDKYNSVNDDQITDIREIHYLEGFLEKHMSDIYDEIMKNEFDYEMQEFDAEDKLETAITERKTLGIYDEIE